jgi:NAD(P)-dependent dehydrogenase (short-subunit alcohol dehydrogenase family)
MLSCLVGKGTDSLIEARATRGSKPRSDYLACARLWVCLTPSSTGFGRRGQPEDIAKAVVFLASDDAAWITGEQISVSGTFCAIGSKYSTPFIPNF